MTLRPVDRPAREFSDGECTGLQDVGKVGPRRDVDWSVVAVRVAEGPPIQVGHEKSNERRKSLLHSRQVSVARLAVLRFYRRKLRHRDQDLTNSLNDLLLFCRGELGQAERLVLYFDLARAQQVEFVVRLDSDRGQYGNGHQREQAG